MAPAQAAKDLNELRELRYLARRNPSGARYVIWGSLSVVAVFAASLSIALVVSTTRTTPVREAARPPVSQPIQRQAITEHEIARLRDALGALAAERDRLVIRVEQIERSLGDITASINVEKPPAPEKAETPRTVPAAAVVAPQPRPAAEMQKQAAAKEPPAAAPRQILQSIESTATKTEFAVDLGGEANLDGLRALWASIRGNHGATLEGLRPLVTIREGSKAGMIELRLVAGPLANAGAAARLCAALQAKGVACKTAVYDGQRLALR